MLAVNWLFVLRIYPLKQILVDHYAMVETVYWQLGISKTWNGKERNEQNEGNAREIYRVTANVCVATVCTTHTVAYKLQNRCWVARKAVCKFNDCILGRKSSMKQDKCTGS